MPDIPALSICEVKYVYVSNGQTCMNVLHYYNKVVVAGADPVALEDSLLDVFADEGPTSIIAAIRAAWSNQVLLKQVTVQLVHPVRYIVRTSAKNLAGTQVGDVTAQNVQASLVKRGILGLRNNVGGLRLGGLNASKYHLGLLDADQLALMKSLAVRLEDAETEALYNSEWSPGILNKEKIPNTDPPKFRVKGIVPIFKIDALQPLRTMSRRTLGRGI